MSTAGAAAVAGTAIAFPGIGPTEFADMAKFLLVDNDARELTAVADDVLGYSVIDRYGQAEQPYEPPERVAFLLVCLALARRAERAAGAPAGLCAGPSFGGLPAAVHAGALTLPDAVTITAEWTTHVKEFFATAYSDVVTQSFARVPAEELAEIRAELAAEGEWSEIACHVDERFWMLSVRESRLEWLRQRLRAVGGFPLYTMRPPMHSPAFAPLRDRIERELFAGLPFADPAIPVVCDHDGSLLTSAEGVRTMLLDGVVRPVSWPAVADAFAARGVAAVYVAGPDGLWGRVPCMSSRFDVVTLTPRDALRPRGRPRQSALAGSDR